MTKENKLIRTQVCLTPEQHSFLTVQARKTGKSAAEHIRSLVDKALEEAEPKGVKYFTMDPSGVGLKETSPGKGLNHIDVVIDFHEIGITIIRNYTDKDDEWLLANIPV